MSQYIKQILAVLIGLGMIILIIVLIVRGFSSNPNSTAPNEKAELVTFASTDAVVALTVDNRIVNEADHRAFKIFVAQKEIGIDIIQGYQGNVIEGRRYVNDQASYAVFLRALQIQNFTQGNDDPELQDERGYCPTGNRFIYQLIGSATESTRLWSTSCSGQGTLRGNASVIRGLFYAQIPQADFNELTRGLSR